MSDQGSWGVVKPRHAVTAVSGLGNSKIPARGRGAPVDIVFTDFPGAQFGTFIAGMVSETR